MTLLNSNIIELLHWYFSVFKTVLNVKNHNAVKIIITSVLLISQKYK